jgi:hypothetical protein
MINAAIYTETLTAGESIHRLFQGAFFKIISATGPVTVRTSTVKLASLIAGQGFEKAPFDFLELTDASGGANTIKFVVATDGFLDGLNGSVSVTGTVAVKSSAFANTAKTVTSASGSLIVANTDRSYLLIQNKSNTGTIWVNFGAAAATQANGVKIAPGGSYELSGTISTQAIQAIGDIASNAEIVVVEG